MIKLPKFSLGVGDRFGKQARAQLVACDLAVSAGVDVIPVWNKSNREHDLVGSEPSETRLVADIAVRTYGWTKPYFVDADHVTMATIPRFIAPCDYFTLDVAGSLGQSAARADVQEFVLRHPELVEGVFLPQTGESLRFERSSLELVAGRFLDAVQTASAMYRVLRSEKGDNKFITEISIDEVEHPQTPEELLVILVALADLGVPVQTIAPKFRGGFNKGVDYVGHVKDFCANLESDAAVIELAITRYGLPDSLKLSIHSGSDKFAVYPAIYDTLVRTGRGVHLKTAGTTWLEEVYGLAQAGRFGLQIAKEVYAQAYDSAYLLVEPYATVVNIEHAELPSPQTVNSWTGPQYCAALKNDSTNPAYNRNFRQLLHIAFRVAAQMGSRYLEALDECDDLISRNVTANLFERHIRPVFLGQWED